MSKKSLAILMRARMRGGSAAVPSPLSLPHEQPHAPLSSPHDLTGKSDCAESSGSTANSQRIMAKDVKEWMHTSISIPAGAKESADSILDKFSQGYLTLAMDDRRDLLISLAKDHDVNRARVRDLMAQYLNLEISHGDHSIGDEDGGASPSLYRMERSLRDALKPMYANFFERLNAQSGGLKLLAVLRADLLALLAVENVGSLRALDSYMKEKLITWLSPAALELHHVTWDDSASLLEKIVEYEAVHPIRNLIDLKRRLGVGRRCFGYFHPAIPGEPLIFIEVALLKDIASSIQEVLWDDPPIAESKAHCALFYSISSTQPGLSGINLGKFLLKRVINMVKRDMPSVQKYATISPIPGFMQWLNSKLASQLKLAESEAGSSDQLENRQSSTFRENLLLSHEEKMILDSIGENDSGKSGIEVMHEMLQSKDWTKSEHICTALKSPLMRLCTRYLIKEKKRGKALDSVANFHLQNGAYIERINWMADQSEKGIKQSGGIMVNYVYRLENIEEYAQQYFNSGNIHASPELYQSLEVMDQ